MSSSEVFSYGSNVVPYDYGTSDDKKSGSSKAPRFNGDPETFSWWKTKCIVSLWVDMMSFGMFLKMVLVTWP
ncbi:hypothetical protein MtrunA17_Chr3g0095211 [Medicago truncatula]|uniref:Uncharacterized protein n=1 Tax=Medicago truncatula TaxID=3880 RepID=A0A396IQF7_MEDTR|nr:hypothetical protein MtrunA17_Chr3g0095211 [Medicago truncatula]